MNSRRRHHHNRPRNPLILCATLVQHPANLGGLCRLAEVFQLQSLVLSQLAIAQSSAFRGLAVSAQRWQPLTECAVAQLPTQLHQWQSQGYALLGLDVSPTATPITSFAFPKQSVILLGRELTGIPTPLLHQCDRTLTIPQYGLVESLNVQHAGAIAIYEYIRQHPVPA